MELLKGKVAVVTGASSDVGHAVCVALGRCGVKVLLNYYRNEAGARKTLSSILSSGGEATIFKADLRCEDDVVSMLDAAVDRWGRLDIVVNNAKGGIIRKSVIESDWEDFQEHLWVTLKGGFLLARHAVPHMKKGGYGRIVNILDAVMEQPVRGYAAFASALSSISGFSRTLAVEVGEFGITVNNILPGFTLTSETPYAPEWVREKIREQTPLKRLAVPEDIANAVLFFASEMSGFTTGATLTVDGGI